MTNQKRLNYINHHNLNITEHTVINVDPAQLLDDPTDPTLYIDDLTTNIYLVLSSSDGQQLATGDFDDIISYIDAQISRQTKRKIFYRILHRLNSSQSQFDRGTRSYQINVKRKDDKYDE